MKSESYAPLPAPPELERRIRAALPTREAWPIADSTPQSVGDAWLTPKRSPVTHSFVLEWRRPKEQEGWPTTVFYAASEGVFWLHEGFLRGGLSTHQVWFGPFIVHP